MFSKIFLKKKYSFKIWLAIMVLISAIMLIVIIQFIASQDGNKDPLNIILGAVFGVVGMAFASGESLLMDQAFRSNTAQKLNFKTNSLIFWRFGTSVLFLVFVVSPSLGLIFEFNNDLGVGFEVIFQSFGAAFVGIEPIILICLTLISLFAHLAYYRSIKIIGADKANIIEQSNSLITPIVAGIVFGIVSVLNIASSIEGASIYQFPSEIQIWFQPVFWISALIVFSCSLYITLYQERHDEIKY